LNTRLTEKDFNHIHWEKDSGGPETFELIIHGKSEQDCKNKKQQILDNQEIVTLCRFLDFDAILFALNRDLQFKHKNNPESHLHLKISQVKQLREVLGKTNHSNDSGGKKNGS